MIEASSVPHHRRVGGNFIASQPAEEVYHAAQECGFTWGAVRAPEGLVDDAHLPIADSGRGWITRARPQLRLSGRGRHLQRLAVAYLPAGTARGEHNQEIFCGELGLSLQELSMLAENRVI